MGLITNAPQLIEHPFQELGAMTNDVDALASVLAVVKEQMARLKQCEYDLRTAIGNLARGDTKTQRVQGNEWTCKVEFPNTSWSQPVLKKLWENNHYQETGLVPTYLKIATLGVQLREVNKLRTTSGNQLFEEFKEQLLLAEQESGSPPTTTPVKQSE